MIVADLDVVVCVDANYALPLAVTLTSLDRAVGDPAATVRVHAMHSGLAPEVQRRVTASLKAVEVLWYAVDATAVAGAHFPDWISAATLYRLWLAELLPADVDRVLYLDSDVVVTGSLLPAAHLDLGDAVVGAVRDAGNPFPARGFQPCWRELGQTPSAPYFNAGVLVIDVARWRDERVGERCLEILRRTRPLYADQDALNAVLEGRWKALPRRWNVQTNDLFDGCSWALDPDDAAAGVADPLVVHYTERDKPWEPGSSHPRRDLWFEAVDQSGWAGWRPQRPRLAAWTDAAANAARAVRRRLRTSALPRP